MGRGRQKAKQQKIARKLKYLTTDTDYVELAKELNSSEPGQGSFDPFASSESYEEDTYLPEQDSTNQTDATADVSDDDDLDEYAKWAAEAAAKAVSNENSAAHTGAHAPVHHHIPMPVPSFMHKHDK
ncbi:hypothetical protein AXE77_04970 [Gardnerella vaginalis]|uniref:DUF3073 domain-containing protein n=1 Tax=Gardnerella vaginalis TaxID=2702 RepID=A0A3E1IZL9_GARVA|nr:MULTISPECIES: DUF3073 domain-containing protein [Gardnerella]RFD78460.1 hypothetical protein AXE77_04970 [Gardnerella vaginalis]